MKKIIGAAAAGLVLTGAAFADLQTSLNVRMGGSVITNQSYDDSDKNRTSVLDLGSGDFGGDSLTFKASTEYAGVTLNFAPTLQTKEAGNNIAKEFWSKGNGVELNAWAKPTDWLKFQVGAHKDGIFYAEQVKKDADDTSWGGGAGKYAFLHKPGVITQVSTGYFLDSLTDVGNGGQAYLFTEFSFKGVGPGALTIRPTFVSTGVDFLQKKDKEKKDAVMQTAPGVLVAYKIDNLVNVNVDFQMPTNKDIAAGLYISPSVMDGLQLMVGGTFSTNLSSEEDDLGYETKDSTPITITRDTSYYAFDLRLRYVAGAFHIANAFNYTGASEEKSVVQKNGSKATGDSEIWDAIFLTYQLNDRWTLTGDVQLDAVLGTVDNKSKDSTVLDLYATPGVMYTFGKGATITTGVHFNFLDLTDGKGDKAGQSTIISVPFVFRVKM